MLPLWSGPLRLTFSQNNLANWRNAMVGWRTALRWEKYFIYEVLLCPFCALLSCLSVAISDHVQYFNIKEMPMLNALVPHKPPHPQRPTYMNHCYAGIDPVTIPLPQRWKEREIEKKRERKRRRRGESVSERGEQSCPVCFSLSSCEVWPNFSRIPEVVVVKKFALMNPFD